MIRIVSLVIVVLSLAGCAASTSDMFPEAVGNRTFSPELFASGGFRLGPARNTFAVTSAEVDQKKAFQADDHDTVLSSILSNPSGDDLSYFYLGWIAEKKGMHDAAYEYYSLAKVLFEYDVLGASTRFGATLKRNAGENLISLCGYPYRRHGHFGMVQYACPEGLPNLIQSGIQRSENKL